MDEHAAASSSAALLALLLLALGANAVATPADDVTPATTPRAPFGGGAEVPGATEIVRRALARRCADNYTVTCLKMDLVSLVDRLSTKETYEIIPSLAVVKTEARRLREGAEGEGKTTAEQRSTISGIGLPEEVVRDLARGLPEAGDARAVQRLDEYLLGRMAKYLDSHSLSVNLLETSTLAQRLGEEVMQRMGFQQAEGGRKGGGGGFGGGKKGGLGMLGAMMIMSKATVGAIAMGGLALLAGKALIVGLLSLLLSAIVGIKALSSKGGGGSITYEIVQKPVYSHAHSHSHEEIHSGGHGHGSGGYRRRSYEVDPAAHDMAYSSYLPERDAVVSTDGAR
ncbi:uncharacterized protein [Hetaerina americana]|uniref:uncharacterized protein n=1 Tax=Hetaerina americana TaxID=62018 RepID=UPI003A7F3A09